MDENQYPTDPEDLDPTMVDRIRKVFSSNQRIDPIASRPTQLTIRTHTHESNIWTYNSQGSPNHNLPSVNPQD